MGNSARRRHSYDTQARAEQAWSTRLKQIGGPPDATKNKDVAPTSSLARCDVSLELGRQDIRAPAVLLQPQAAFPDGDVDAGPTFSEELRGFGDRVPQGDHIEIRRQLS